MYTENLSIQSFDEELWSSLENEKKRQEEVDGYERLKTKESNKLPQPTEWR